LNRASIGTSRYLDLVDNTGKYSSTNSFGSDGGLWQQNILPTILFSWTNRNEIADVITNQVQPQLTESTMRQFYYGNFPRKLINTLDITCTATTITTNAITCATAAFFDYAYVGMPITFSGTVFGGITADLPYYVVSINSVNSTFTVSTTAGGSAVTLSSATGSMSAVTTLSTGGSTWNQSTTLANETTGYFKNSAGTPIAVGDESTTNFLYAIVGSLVRFVPPPGYFFDKNNKLQLGIPTKAEERVEIWASPIRVTGDGMNSGLGNLINGSGPVILNNFVPTGAIVDTIIPLFVTDLPLSIESAMSDQIALFRNFGLGYDNDGSITGTPYSWYLIQSTNLNQDAAWSQEYAGNTSGANLDSSWLIQFVVNFGSVLQTRFFFYDGAQIYDSRTGTVIKDFINVLAVNTQPNSSEPLEGDIYMTITGQPVESDGYVDDFQVLVGYRDSDNDGVPDNPDFFSEIVGPAGTTGPYVFLQQTVDFDNLQRYLLVEEGVVIYSYATLDDIELVKTEWSSGQVFYAYSEDAFYQLSLTVTGVLELNAVTGWIARTGRQSLYYQYRHNSPLTSRIDPGTTNIIDLYVVTLSYYNAYQNWLKDTTGTVTEPEQPTIDDLSTEYQRLQDYKMVSDNIVVNSVNFKPLFGLKAAATLRATIKVIRAQNSTASTSEIKSSVLAEMNSYFSIDKWNFGDTFFDVIEALTSTNLRTAAGSGVI